MCWIDCEIFLKMFQMYWIYFKCKSETLLRGGGVYWLGGFKHADVTQSLIIALQKFNFITLSKFFALVIDLTGVSYMKIH